jgi:hypothetical protein
MYLTHTFANRETLSRAHSWLTRLGFHPRHAASGIPRIMIVDEMNRLAEARVLINAVESADPNGFPGLWAQTAPPQSLRDESHPDRLSDSGKPHTSVIGWHPLD